MTRLAIIGLGQVTRNIHLPAYRQIKDKVEVVGACDIDASARDSMARQWNLPATFATPEELIEKTKPDIVAICTPPALHREQCLLALSANCHVFCEKPFAESLSEADEVIEAAERYSRQVVINNQFPYMKSHLAAKKMIGTPEFGKLLYLHAWQTFRPNAQTEAGWRGEMRRRLCFEFGIHVFELIRFFFDAMPEKVLAHIPSPVAGARSDAVNVISVEFADGRAASVVLDRLSKGPESYLEMRLDGENAAIQTAIGGDLRFEIGMHTRQRRPFFNFHCVPGAQAVLQDGSKRRVLATDGTNPFASSTATHLSNFIDALAKGVEPPANARDNRNTLALVFAAYDSASSGRAMQTNLYHSAAPEPAVFAMPTGLSPAIDSIR